jgi:hypothetical protein
VFSQRLARREPPGAVQRPTQPPSHATPTAPVRLPGEVIAEPDLRDGATLLTVEVSSFRDGDDGPTQPASGRVTTATMAQTTGSHLRMAPPFRSPATCNHEVTSMRHQPSSPR